MMVRRIVRFTCLQFVLLLLSVTLWTNSARPGIAADLTAESVATPGSVAELKALEARVKKLTAKVTSCTVGIRLGNSNGSGVIVSEDGLVMTAGHVAQGPGKDVTIIMPDGKTLKGKTLGVFKSADAGMIKIAEKGKFAFAEKRPAMDLKVGTWCVATGHPLGYRAKRPPVVRIGRILNVTENVIQTDCPLVGGDSGGPLFDLDGNVIGINSRIGGSILQNFHVPINVYHANWDRLVKGEVWEIKLPFRNSEVMRKAVANQVASVGKCVVRVLCDGKEAALGTVVGPDGWILTKASELKGKIVCRFQDKREFEAAMVGVDPRFDLAMLKIEADELPKINWLMGKHAVGKWVATPGFDGKPMALGVVSVPRHSVPLPSGVLGVTFLEDKEEAVIKEVVPKSPAEKAGLKVEDVILGVNGRAIAKKTELITAVKKFPAGVVVTLKVKRGDKEFELKATLGKIETDGTRKRDMQNALGVGLSKRREGFPVVMQHDTVLPPALCGGPLVDLDGKAIGVNIARGGRTETFSIPADVLVMLMYDLMSGRLRPAAVAQAKAAAEKAAAEKVAKEKAAAEKAAKEKAETEKAAEEKRAAEEKAKQEAEEQAKMKAEQEAKRKQEQEAAKEKAEKEKAAEEKRAADEKAKQEAEEQAKMKAEQEAKRKQEQEAAKEKAAAEKEKTEKAAAEKRKAEDEKRTAREKKKTEEAAAKKAAAEKEAAQQKKADEPEKGGGQGGPPK